MLTLFAPSRKASRGRHRGEEHQVLPLFAPRRKASHGRHRGEEHQVLPLFAPAARLHAAGIGTRNTRDFPCLPPSQGFTRQASGRGTPGTSPVCPRRKASRGRHRDEEHQGLPLFAPVARLHAAGIGASNTRHFPYLPTLPVGLRRAFPWLSLLSTSSTRQLATPLFITSLILSSGFNSVAASITLSSLYAMA